jgi:hypothetical protein
MLPLTYTYFTVIVVSTKTSCRTRQTMLAAGSPAGLAVSWMRPRPAANWVHAGLVGVQPVLAGYLPEPFMSAMAARSRQGH